MGRDLVYVDLKGKCCKSVIMDKHVTKQSVGTNPTTLSIFLTHGKCTYKYIFIYIYVYNGFARYKEKRELTITINKKFLTDESVWQIWKYSKR
jgi:hypothetical protein